jgi:hypothetical protein
MNNMPFGESRYYGTTLPKLIGFALHANLRIERQGFFIGFQGLPDFGDCFETDTARLEYPSPHPLATCWPKRRALCQERPVGPFHVVDRSGGH